MEQGNMGNSSSGGSQSMGGGNNPTQIMQMFKGQDFPMSKEDIVQLAEEQGGQEMRRMAESLPDQQFNSPTDIASAMGGGSGGQSSSGSSSSSVNQGMGSQGQGGSQGGSQSSMGGSSQGSQGQGGSSWRGGQGGSDQ